MSACKLLLSSNKILINLERSVFTGNANLRFRSVNTYLLLAECEVRTASYGPSFFLPFMAQARSARPIKTKKEKTRIHNLPSDRANKANKMFIIWLCWLFRVWKGDWELEVRTATYWPGIDQSQHTKSVSHIIKKGISLIFPVQTLFSVSNI